MGGPGEGGRSLPACWGRRSGGRIWGWVYVGVALSGVKREEEEEEDKEERADSV